MRHLRLPLIAGLIALGAAFAAGPPPALGASYVVDTTDDDVGVALTACAGDPNDCSLRGAITRANAASTPGDVITFDVGVFAPGTIPIDSPLPSLIGGGDTIDGTGATVLIDTTRETGVTTVFNCLLVSSAGNTVKGLQMTDCAFAISVNLNVSDDNVIGPSNVLYDNSFAIGLLASDATGNSVVGNKIGTTADGSAAHPAGGNGQGITISAVNTTVGGTTAADRNIISGNSSGTGITINSSLPTGAVVAGNYIGTSANGLVDLANANGVAITGGASNNTIGGTNPGEGNLISGNDSVNVYLLGGSANTVAGNIIGPDVTGAAPVTLTNGTGVLISSPSTNNTIGPANLISDNDIGVSITVNATANTVKGNLIGTNAAGTSGVPNSSDGIRIDGVGGANTGANTIGGTTPGDGNVIAFNTGDGVEVRGASATNNAIRGNSIHSNTGKGIENVNGGNGEPGHAPPVVTAVVRLRGHPAPTARSTCTLTAATRAACTTAPRPRTITAMALGTGPSQALCWARM